MLLYTIRAPWPKHQLKAIVSYVMHVIQSHLKHISKKAFSLLHCNIDTFKNASIYSWTCPYAQMLGWYLKKKVPNFSGQPYSFKDLFVYIYKYLKYVFTCCTSSTRFCTAFQHEPWINDTMLMFCPDWTHFWTCPCVFTIIHD